MSGVDVGALAEQIGEAAKWVGVFGILSAWFSRQALNLVCDVWRVYHAGRRARRINRMKLLKAANAYASGRTDLGTATGFDPRFLDAIIAADDRQQRPQRIAIRQARLKAWESQQASAGR